MIINKIVFYLSLLFLFSFSILFPKESYASHCIGTYQRYSVACQANWQCNSSNVCEPNPGLACQGVSGGSCCSGHLVCAGAGGAVGPSRSCIHLSDGTCGPDPNDTSSCGFAYNGCSAVSGPTPTPIPGSTPGPPPGSSCSGDCFPGIANCGAVVRPGGSGSCPSGQLCCGSPNAPIECRFGLAPNPVVVAVGQTIRIAPVRPRGIGGGVISNFSYSNTGNYVSFNRASVDCLWWTDRRGNARCSPPAPGDWGTNVTALRPTNGVIANGLRISCWIIDGGITFRVFPLQVVPPLPLPGWWQAVNGDAVSSGDLVSKVPGTTDSKFIDPGTGLFPGVAAYGGSQYDFTSDQATRGSPSLLGWLAQSTYKGRNYNSGYFKGNFSTEIVFNTISGSVNGSTFTGASGNVSPDGFFWYKATGDLTINNNTVIPGTRKVIIVVDSGSLTINGNVSITNPGQGAFVVIVSGDIRVDPTVTTLAGIYLADGVFATGVGASQLAVTGSVVTYGGAALERDLGAANRTTPAEQFTFDPRLIFNIPRSLGVGKIVWKEIQP